MDELKDRMQAFQRCLEDRDVVLAEGVLDPEFALILVHPARGVIPRQQWLNLLPDYVVHSYEVHEQVVDVDGDCAAVFHRATMKATVLGQDRSGTFTISDVWRRRGDSWRLWRRHSTPLSAGELDVGE